MYRLSAGIPERKVPNVFETHYEIAGSTQSTTPIHGTYCLDNYNC